MKFSKPFHQGFSLSINLKSTFLLFSFSLFYCLAFAKSVDSEIHFTNLPTQTESVGVEVKKSISFNDLHSTLAVSNPAQDTASSNEQKLVFLTGFSTDFDSELQTFTILGVEKYPENSLSIFDKWGQEVYTTESYNNDWDGSVDGVMVELGTYYYMFTDGEGKTYSGYVNIESNI